ncbi:MAG: PD-(D/E)XK nuclease family protein [Muribaculaceae bacterium]|nr:PD-(D/E)XK nuclease family protein [Muribaculaceae bacterium]
MSTLPFLQTVAKAYAARYSDLSEICFLFPNKRSGTFFLNYLKKEYHRHSVLAPEVKTITDLVGDLSQRVVASRIDMLFMLYQCYREHLGLPLIEEENDEGISFDSFAGWGETVLSDFNEVDLYLVNTAEIFKNVKDYREISSTFLTEEQRKVMEEYFGHTDMGDPRSFWKNFDGDENKLSEVKQKFLHLWRIMSPLYDRFKARLDEQGLTTVGGMYRQAVRRLQQEGREALPYKKIVAVGFNALSTSEQTIFSELRDCEGYEGYDAFADFFWDATGPVLSGDVNSASKFVRSNIKSFPCPDWALPALKLSDTDKLPDSLRVAASPSNSAQVKIVGNMLGKLSESLPAEAFKDGKVAVVLPDENLLLPLLYSLPDGMGDVNLTMGYPLRLTSVVPFVALLRKLLYNMRTVGGNVSFYNRDLRLLLAHPFSHVLFSTALVGQILRYITDHHKVTITLDELRTIAGDKVDLLTGPDKDATPEVALAYLDSILEKVVAGLPAFEKAMVKSRLEISHIQVYRDALRRLRSILNDYGMKMKPSTVYRLADRLLAGEKVGFEGEPLTGLQVMGTLETRSIDFEHIFILSANERILPMRMRTRSFIPDSLRHAYGMPPSNYAEGIFAYYFYRMISRAKSVTMLYDARSGGGMRNGDVSRYVLQLRYLFAKDKLHEEDWKFILTGKEPNSPTVDKTKEIREKLEEFKTPGGKNLSASALQAYRECQVKFFYRSVIGLSDDPEPSDFIDAITAGNILHEVMQKVYLPDEKSKKILLPPATVTREMIDRLLEDKAGIERLVRHSVNTQHFRLKGEEIDTPLSGAAEMVAARITQQVERVLRHDRELVPFNIYGLELTDNFRVALPNGDEVNFRFAIDRLDEISTEVGKQLRIVDYKTGSIKLEAKTFDELFDGDYKSEHAFQLFTYGWLLGKKRDVPFPTEDVRLEIYDVPGIEKGKVNLPEIGKKDEEGNISEKLEKVNSYKEYSQEFDEGMTAMLNEIFSPEPFKACDEERCGLCSFRTLCRR